ncbi:precorrin-6Y C5,15-methyltransferase (decarboxylating) subunit CbiT [Proteinivorax tanatarense]|uniref:Precorrin-6Y C5,15-methyltransferase (Decarboxylating) subunit CbiT n=1 Tax=Proteinivorax tanatarense TaxID=1260629 RepID=A0AAU7VJS4_9FIRM
MSKIWEYKTYGIPDCMFYRGKVPMTKSEVRSITLSKLQVKSNDILADIGSGTGSISVEMALAAEKGEVYSIEINPDAVNLTKRNAEKFGIANMKIVQGKGSVVIPDLPKLNGVVIGGSKGELSQIFDGLDHKLVCGGKIVVNVITIENLYKCVKLLKQKNYKEIDVTQVLISKGEFIKELTMMKSQNPVFLITAVKS